MSHAKRRIEEELEAGDHDGATDEERDFLTEREMVELGIAGKHKRGPSGGVILEMKPVENELFYFGETVEKFALHKAGRVVGLFESFDQNGRRKKCFRL